MASPSAPAAVAAPRAGAAVWLQTARVRSLAISSVAVLTGAAMAWYDGYLSPWVLAAWLGACAAQAGTNLTNVAWNYKAGLNRVGGFAPDPRGSSAPVREGRLTPDAVRTAAAVCFGVAVVTGIALAGARGWPILALGIPGLVVGWGYAAPPLRLSYRGLGVVAVFVFMGPVMVAGTYFVMAGHFALNGLVASLPVGFTAAAIMHINDVRDFDSDVAHLKATLATRLGREGAVTMLGALTLGAYISLTVAVWRHALPWTTLGTLTTLPLAITQWRHVKRERDSSRLNLAWFMGVKLHTQFGALLIAGLLLGRLVRP